MGLYIAGSIFLALTIIWFFIQRAAERNKKHEEATKDGKDAIASHNTVRLFRAIRERMLRR